MSSAPAVSSSPAGTQSTPSRPATNTTTMASDHALPGTCSTTRATAPMASPTRATGTRRGGRRPPGPRGDDRLDAGGGEERRAQREAGGAQRVEAQRRQHVEHAEGRRRQRREPHADQHRALAQRRRRRREDLRAAARGHRERPGAQRDAEQHRGRERRLAPDRGGQRADHRAELHPEDGRAQDAADHLAAALARRLARHPGHAARPRARPAHALHEARDVEHDDRRAEGEGQPADRHQRQTRGAPWPSRRRAPPASRPAARRCSVPAA